MRRMIEFLELLRRKRFNGVLRLLLLPYKYVYTKLRYRTTRQFILSYPKSGRTWVRFFLAKYYSIHFKIPVMLDSAPILAFLAPFLPKRFNPAVHIGYSHLGYDISSAHLFKDSQSKLIGKKVLFLIRDPRDIVISYYWHCHHRMLKKPMNMPPKDLSGFIRDPEYGIQSIIHFLNIWYDYRSRFNSFFVISYESLWRDPDTAFRAILSSWGISNISETAFEEALKFSQFDSMKAMESSGSIVDPSLSSKPSSEESMRKVRSGGVGKYREALSASDQNYVDEAFKSLNPALQALM